MGKGPFISLGLPKHLFLLTTIPHQVHHSVRALLPHQPKGLGDEESDITFLLISAKEVATGDRKYALATIWVNPCQAWVPSMEEAARELTAWVPSRPNWPYTLVQLNEDTCHVPLPKKGHLGILPKRGTNNSACRRISQLEVHQLLISGLQVA